MAKGRVTEKERKKIIEALEVGESQTSVAKRFKRGSATINRIAKEAGLEYSAPKNANKARRLYAKDGRIRLIEKALAKTEEFLDKDMIVPANLYQWTMGLAVLIDKRRQEDDDDGRRRGSIRALMDHLRGSDDDDAGTPEG